MNSLYITSRSIFFFIFVVAFFKFYFWFILLYNTVLVLSYIDMNPLRVYTSSHLLSTQFLLFFSDWLTNLLAFFCNKPVLVIFSLLNNWSYHLIGFPNHVFVSIHVKLVGEGFQQHLVCADSFCLPRSYTHLKLVSSFFLEIKLIPLSFTCFSWFLTRSRFKPTLFSNNFHPFHTCF